MRTLTGYGIAVVIVFLVLNAVIWFIRSPPPWAGSFRIFSVGFVLGMAGMYIASILYGYHQ